MPTTSAAITSVNRDVLAAKVDAEAVDRWLNARWRNDVLPATDGAWGAWHVWVCTGHLLCFEGDHEATTPNSPAYLVRLHFEGRNPQVLNEYLVALTGTPLALEDDPGNAIRLTLSVGYDNANAVLLHLLQAHGLSLLRMREPDRYFDAPLTEWALKRALCVPNQSGGYWIGHAWVGRVVNVKDGLPVWVVLTLLGTGAYFHVATHGYDAEGRTLRHTAFDAYPAAHAPRLRDLLLREFDVTPLT